MRHVPRHAFPPSHPHGFPQCYLLFLLELRFRGAGQVQEYQDFMKLFKPEILDKQMRVALEMKCVSLPLLTSESWQVLSHSRLQMKPANVTPECSTCPPIPSSTKLGSCPCVQKNGGFQSAAHWVYFKHA